ncbi:MAG: hypothetical protein K2Q45_03105 [Nitrosomonas sp.]|nr:hypothetical protein [Nitrosomonas sp.]
MDFIPIIISSYGRILLAKSCVGLVIGTFELAFERVYGQVILRMLLHMISIPVAVYLLSLTQLFPLSTVYEQSKALLILCIFSVGVIGISIGTLELGLITMKPNLINRMTLYAIFMFAALPVLPLK